MATKELIAAVNGYEAYIKQNGITEEAIDAYCMAVRTAYFVENDTETGKKLSRRCKNIINSFIFKETGADFFTLEKYCKDNNVNYKIVDQFYDILLVEAQHMNLDSALLYLEKKRDWKDRYYQPRRKCFTKIGLVKSLQDMLDDKLDILSISLPPGTGKLISNDTDVLTTNGWKKHGELVVGDYVYGLHGEKVKVTHIHPKNFANKRVHFSDKTFIDCHENHEWFLYDRFKNDYEIYETKFIEKNISLNEKNKKRFRFFIPQKEPLSGDEDIKLHVDPYVLGSWLGGKTNMESTYLRNDLQKYGMCETTEKHIPVDYLNASYEKRLDLLAGLIDTDSCLKKKEKGYIYTTNSESLKDDVISLISTFGWRLCSSSGIVGRETVYSISFTPDVLIPCRDNKKQLSEISYSKRKISIVKIEDIEPTPGNCITVEGGIYRVGKRLIPTHNSTMEKFFHSLVCGWFQDDYNLFYSHSADITRMYYDGILDILTNHDEYTWDELFPGCRVTSTNAKLEQINIGKYKPFPNVQCTSVGAKNAGKVRASKFLLCDDLIGGIEEALNISQLEKLWSIYSVDARQRKVTGCKEIHIATRWSVHDVIGRLQNTYAGSERCRFIAVPDIDPETNKSNFYFDINPFTVEFYNDQEKLMDDVSYRCLYKNEPIEREGLLFPEDKLRRFFHVPKTEPEEITGQVDCKGKGTDYMVMPVFEKYGDDYYLVDVVCSNDADYEMQYESLANMIVDTKMQNCEFESNAGGDRVALETEKRVKNKGWICNITSAPTETNKEARIFQCSNWILQNILFKDKSLYSQQSPYGVFMRLLMSYSVSGKNPTDDVPDVLSNFAIRKTKGSRIATVEAIVNPFRRGIY